MRHPGKLSKAEMHCSRALEMKVRKLGNSHRDVAKSLNDLWLVMLEQGKLPKAQQYFSEALGIVDTDESSETARSLCGMGQTMQRQAKLSESVDIHHRHWASERGFLAITIQMSQTAFLGWCRC